MIARITGVAGVRLSNPLIYLLLVVGKPVFGWGSTLKSLDILVIAPKIGFEQVISGDFTFKKS